MGSTVDSKSHDAGAITKMRQVLECQKAASRAEGVSTAARRIDWLDRVIGMTVDHKDEIADALCEDFGNRSREATLIADVFAVVGSLKFAKEHLRDWMKAASYDAPFPDGQASVEYHPLGVVGMMSPWNFPFNLTLAPLAGIIAAGNRCIIKPSELTPASSDLLARMIASAFDETEIAVILGGTDVAAEFSRLPFDHLLFTGGTAVAKHVMRAAAENLVPVTLELGGKSPVVVSNSASIEDAAARVMTVKTLNAGQICLAPDYIFIPDGKTDEFVAAATKSVATMFPTLKDNPDYTSIINQRHYERLQSYLEDARKSGAKIVEINPKSEDFSQQPARRIPPTLVINPGDDTLIMNEEIFGPLLPVRTYKKVDEVIDYINDRPSPLALYYFGEDKGEERRVVEHTRSGGVTINDVMAHAFVETLPFGGVGASGMGSYHGKAGFLAFSHARSVYRQSRSPEAEHMLRPPYGDQMRQFLAAAITK